MIKYFLPAKNNNNNNNDQIETPQLPKQKRWILGLDSTGKTTLPNTQKD